MNNPHQSTHPTDIELQLLAAAEHGQADAVKALLTQHPELAQSSCCVGATGYAAANGFMDTLSVLLEANGDLARGTSGRAALKMAAGNGEVEALKLLLERTPDLASGKSGSEALNWASQEGQLDAMTALLESNPNLAKGKSGREALNSAARAGEVESLDFLLEKNPGLAHGISGQKAFELAQEAGHELVMERLQKHNPELSSNRAIAVDEPAKVVSNQEQSSAHVATSQSGSEAIPKSTQVSSSPRSAEVGEPTPMPLSDPAFLMVKKANHKITEAVANLPSGMISGATDVGPNKMPNGESPGSGPRQGYAKGR